MPACESPSISISQKLWPRALEPWHDTTLVSITRAKLRKLLSLLIVDLHLYNCARVARALCSRRRSRQVAACSGQLINSSFVNCCNRNHACSAGWSCFFCFFFRALFHACGNADTCRILKRYGQAAGLANHEIDSKIFLHIAVAWPCIRVRPSVRTKTIKVRGPASVMFALHEFEDGGKRTYVPPMASRQAALRSSSKIQHLGRLGSARLCKTS